MLSDQSLLLLLFLGASVNSKPIDGSSNEEVNEIDTGTHKDYKNVGDVVDVTEVGEVPSPFERISNEKITSSSNRISGMTSTTMSPKITGDKLGSEKLGNGQNGTSDNSPTPQQGFAWIFSPFTQKIQFSPQAFFEDRIGQLKDTLSHIGSIFPNQQDGGSKQFGNSGGLANIAGLNDSGFYTNRLDPVGFFGGNGWFANKGGILGGPGAFISTGSLLTDYPTPYRK